MEEFDNDFLFKNKPDETTPKSAENLNVALKNTRAICSDTAGSHNAIFRGKDITNYFDDGSLWERISSGKFTDLFVGDYIIKSGITWRIAGFDIYYTKGDINFTKHHAVIVPDTNLTSAQMKDSNNTTGGFVASLMYTDTLTKVLNNYVNPVFSEHVLEYKKNLTNSVNASAYNRFGTNTGASSGWENNLVKLDLMNEIQIFGCVNWSSSGYEIGYDNVQFPLFKHSQNFVRGSGWYWLKTIVSSTNFAHVDNTGYVNTRGNSSSVGGVRPYFLID